MPPKSGKQTLRNNRTAQARAVFHSRATIGTLDRIAIGGRRRTASARRVGISAKGAFIHDEPGAAPQDLWHTKRLALKARFKHDVTRSIGAAFISATGCFGLRNIIVELNRAFSAWVSSDHWIPGALPQASGECCAFGAKYILCDIRARTAKRPLFYRMNSARSGGSALVHSRSPSMASFAECKACRGNRSLCSSSCVHPVSMKRRYNRSSGP